MACKYCIESKFTEIMQRAFLSQKEYFELRNHYPMSSYSFEELQNLLNVLSKEQKEIFIEHACHIVNTDCKRCKEEYCNHQYIQMLKDGKAVFACSKCFKGYDKKVKVK